MCETMPTQVKLSTFAFILEIRLTQAVSSWEHGASVPSSWSTSTVRRCQSFLFIRHSYESTFRPPKAFTEVHVSHVAPAQERRYTTLTFIYSPPLPKASSCTRGKDNSTLIQSSLSPRSTTLSIPCDIPHYLHSTLSLWIGIRA